MEIFSVVDGALDEQQEASDNMVADKLPESIELGFANNLKIQDQICE